MGASISPSDESTVDRKGGRPRGRLERSLPADLPKPTDCGPTTDFSDGNETGRGSGHPSEGFLPGVGHDSERNVGRPDRPTAVASTAIPGAVGSARARGSDRERVAQSPSVATTEPPDGNRV
jgi:hypothetical protein